MHKEPSHRECLPQYTGALQYHTYQYDKYEVHDGTVFGLPGSHTLQPEDKHGIYERFHALFPEYEDYEYCTRDELRKRALRLSSATKDDQDATPHTIQNGVELLTDFLDIYDEHIKGITVADAEGFEKMTVALCEKYGLLDWQSVLALDVSMGLDFEEVAKNLPWEQEHIWYSFQLTSFCRGLMQLRVLYLCWRVLFWGVNSQAKEELDELLDKFSLLFHLPRRKRNINISTKLKLNLKRWMSEQGFVEGEHYYFPSSSDDLPDIEYNTCHYHKVIENMSSAWNPRPVISFCDDTPITIYKYGSPLDAAMGCMLSIISKGVDGLEQRTMQVCERCANAFIRQHGRQRFCKNCGSNAVRVREHRARQAKEAQHGTKSEQ